MFLKLPVMESAIFCEIKERCKAFGAKIIARLIVVKKCTNGLFFYIFAYYGVHSVPKPFNKLIHLANKINQFSLFNKIALWFII